MRSLLLSACFLLLAARAAYPQSWEQTAGPLGGSVLDITVTRDGDLYAFAGTEYFVSNDGVHWRNAHFQFKPGELSHPLYESPSGAFLVPFNRNRAGGYGIARSTDFGAHWDTTTLPVTGVFRLFTDSYPLLALTGYAVLQSTDDGASWGRISDAILPITAAIRPPSCIYRSPKGTIFTSFPNYYDEEFDEHGNRRIVLRPSGSALSFDSGRTWRPSYHYLGRCFEHDGKLYDGYAVSADEGLTWTFLTPTSYHSPVIFASSGTLFGLRADGTLDSSADFGATWSHIGGRYSFGEHFRAFAVDWHSGVHIGTNFGSRIYRDTGWVLTNDSLIASSPGSLQADSSGFLYVLVRQQFEPELSSKTTAYYSRDGYTWRDLPAPVKYPFALIPVDSTLLFALDSHRVSYRSTDMGATWSAISASLRSVVRFAQDTLVALNGIYLLASWDNGSTWTTIDTFSTAPEELRVQYPKILVRPYGSLTSIRAQSLADVGTHRQ